MALTFGKVEKCEMPRCPENPGETPMAHGSLWVQAEPEWRGA